MTRTPPVGVRRQLRAEVGFGCPVGQCGSPYLEYHHFDPPWAERNHHEPDGMIALCPTHHAKADAWTVEDLRTLKAAGKRKSVTGRFEWMRDDVLAVVGGNYYYETPVMVSYADRPLIWFERDERRRLLLNLNMISLSREPRARLENNDWIVEGDPIDVDSPTNGSRLGIRYENGDALEIRFREWGAKPALYKRFPRVRDLHSVLKLPLVTAEVELAIGGSSLGFSAGETTLPRHNTIRGCVFDHCRVGLAIGQIRSPFGLT